MDAAAIMEILKSEYDINNTEELFDAAGEFPGICLGIFTEPMTIGGTENAERIRKGELALA